jgi:hypothetical protein
MNRFIVEVNLNSTWKLIMTINHTNVSIVRKLSLLFIIIDDTSSDMQRRKNLNVIYVFHSNIKSLITNITHESLIIRVDTFVCRQIAALWKRCNTHITFIFFSHINICDKKFYRRSKLELHLKTHYDDKPYKCKNSWSHTSHLYVISPLCCLWCIFSWDILLNFMSHSSHLNRSLEKTFAVIYYYRRHVKRHAEKKEFKCDLCMKGFHLKESYQFHLVTHDKSKRKHCDTCLKTFVKESQLKQHVCSGAPVDTVKDRFKCDECDIKYFPFALITCNYTFVIWRKIISIVLFTFILLFQF